MQSIEQEQKRRENGGRRSERGIHSASTPADKIRFTPAYFKEQLKLLKFHSTVNPTKGGSVLRQGFDATRGRRSEVRKPLETRNAECRMRNWRRGRRAEGPKPDAGKQKPCDREWGCIRLRRVVCGVSPQNIVPPICRIKRWVHIW